MRVRYTKLALSDLDEVHRYIAARNGRAVAARVVRQIENAIQDLTRFPNRGRKGRLMGTLELVVTRTPFVVAYRAEAGEVQILAVVHGARRWPTGL